MEPMPSPRVFAAALAALSLAGCGSGPDVEVSAGDPNLNTRWHATLASPRNLAGVVQMTGVATMAPAAGGKTEVAMTLANATSGGVHPWQVRRGQCGTDEGVLGPPEAYDAIEVADDGRASVSATLALPTPAAGRYFVSVQASRENPGLVVACGNLAAPTR
jgi:hypothetical protein